ncbi:MAG: hypothetical protein SGJ00_04085 [bacterium]|nr:hypothetical protein [bacterium]
MKKTNTRILLLLLAGFYAMPTVAQEMEQEPKLVQTETKEPKDFKGLSGITKNVIIGYAYSDFIYDPHSEIKTNFTRVGFSPTMVWMLGEKLFFESQVEFYTDSGNINTKIEYLKLSYIINKYMTVGMGKMLTPFGLYTERIEAPFIEKLPNAPLGLRQMDGVPNIGPISPEMGVDLRGGFYVGDSKMNYVLYVSNGAKLNDGLSETHLAGTLNYENFFDNNSNKSFGGRIGYLPLSNSSLEIGGSWSYSEVGDVKTAYEHLMSKAYSFDVTYHKTYPALKSMIDFKGQVNFLEVDKANYFDEKGDVYSFENRSNIYYVRLSLRPALVHNKYMKRFEFIGRYSVADFANDALWGGYAQRTDLGISYWLSLRIGLRIAYEKGDGLHGVSTEAILVRFVTGF